MILFNHKTKQKFICRYNREFLKSCKKVDDSFLQIPDRQNILTQLAVDISNECERLSTEINTDCSFESADSKYSKDNFLFGYAEDPEYKEKELKSMEFSDDNKSNSNEEENDLNFSRQENLHWCKFLHCIVMPTSIECKCCKELNKLDLEQIMKLLLL